jgi:hypothetical protein
MARMRKARARDPLLVRPSEPAVPRYVEMIRVSTKGQADSDTPELQRRALDRLRERRPGTLVERIEALGQSGAAPFDERPDLMRLLELSKAGAFDEVRVYAIDRLTRSYEPDERWDIWKLVRKAGAVIVDANDNVIDPADRSGASEYRSGVRSVDMADVRISGAQPYEELGRNMSTGGDLDGDGLADLAIGAVGKEDLGEGVIYVFGGDTAADETEVVTADADATIRGNEYLQSISDTMDTAGDLDGDGFDDLVMGSTRLDKKSQGSVWGLYGPLDGAFVAPVDAAFTIAATPGLQNPLPELAFVGDVAGDSHDDLAFGEHQAGDGAPYVGMVHIFEGRSF